MAGNPSVFAHVYELQFVGGEYVLVDSTPSGDDVTVKDDINDGDDDVHSEIGDVANDSFDVLQSGDLNGSYTFVSVAQLGGGGGFIAENAAGDFVYFTNDTLTPADVGTPLAPQAGPLAVCFMPGTMIATPAGEAVVESLAIGDLVTTADGRAAPVRWIGRQTVAPRFADELRLPVRVKAGALGDNVPARDLLLSPDHALFVDGALIHAGALVNGSSIVRERDVPASFIYYHIEVDDHALILAENAPAETFVDNVDRRRFDNFAEYEALYPQARAISEMPLPRAKAWRQVPQSTRERLAARAAALSGAVEEAA
jgi:hypothetical protein